MSSGRSATYARSRSKRRASPKNTRAKSKKKAAQVIALPTAPEQSIGTELRLMIPTTIRKNISHRAVPCRNSDGELIAKPLLSTTVRNFREYVNVLCLEQGLPKNIAHGRWGVEIVAYWPRLRHLDDGEDIPYGDVDAPITQVLDAVCKGARVFDDDIRLGPLTADREHDPENPRIELLFKRWR